MSKSLPIYTISKKACYIKFIIQLIYLKLKTFFVQYHEKKLYKVGQSWYSVKITIRQLQLWETIWWEFPVFNIKVQCECFAKMMSAKSVVQNNANICCSWIKFVDYTSLLKYNKDSLYHKPEHYWPLLNTWWPAAIVVMLAQTTDRSKRSKHY